MEDDLDYDATVWASYYLDDQDEEFSKHKNDGINCKCGVMLTGQFEFAMHLNDIHEMSFRQIADYLDLFPPVFIGVK